MMKILYFFSLLLLMACHQNRKPEPTTYADQQVKKDSAAQKSNQLLYAATDTICIVSESGYDTFYYSKNNFNEIVDHFPELHEEIPDHPDIAFAKSGAFKDITDKDGNKKHISFGSELGQDNFYILYAYFLKPKNDSAARLRKKLREAYHIINRVFHTLHGFGTYYDHQHRRIQAYAAYDTYNYSPETDEEFIRDINTEKKYFLASLKQEVSNRIKANNEILPAAKKAEVARDLYTDIQQLDTLITTQYLLHRVCAFRYSYYQ